ncbi:major facilitator superfamily domain-containing protein [Mariannaea sp. PMI_226]|nr:major facilitator superfamily domain-containing protein [Mariannaea sp. PMI_226]
MEIESRVEIIPGTEIMTDLGDTSLVHAGSTLDSVVLIPRPTKDPHDPLNWSSIWKTLVLITQGSFVFFSVITNLSIAPLTPLYMEEWGKSQSQVALLTGATVLSLGYANFIIIPCSEVFGRRVVLIICASITIASCIWQAVATSYSSFLGARVLTGIGAAANESIMPVVIADIKFLHQRGKYIGLYFYCYFMGLFIGPIISGAVAQRTSWRWFFWACTISQSINLICIVFMFPETRRLSKESTSLANESSLGGSESPDASSKERTERIEDATSNAISPYLGRGSPIKGQFSLFQPIDRQATRHILRHIITPVQIFFYPIIFWAAMSMGAAANSLLCINLLQSQALAAPPYNFNSQNVGFANFALVVGGLVGLAIAGTWSDWIAMRATEKNGGIREPEMRLPALIPFIICAVLGMVVIGVGLQRSWPWEAVIIVGFTLVGCIVVSIPTLCITYAIDCYKPIAGEIMVISTVCKNTFGFGMSYYINDWAARAGFMQPIFLLMALTVGFPLIGLVVFIFYGKQMRKMTKNSKLHEF